MTARGRRGFTQRISALPDGVAGLVDDHDCMATKTPIVELADRHSDDLDVVLVWGRRTGRVWVNVTHRRSGRRARIDASPATALDVFHHPFAYASRAA